MAFANVIDIKKLSEAISSERPHGVDIRASRSPASDYYTIKDSRNSARAAERAALFDVTDVDLLAPWREVARTAEKILMEESKDLEVASWYTEALIRLHGFAGLRDGLGLIEQLIAQYWDALYPEPDEDGIETKVAPLAGLNGDGADGTLLMPIRNADITPANDDGSFSFFHYQQARDADRITDEEAKATRIGALGYDIGAFEGCVSAVPAQWAQDLIETLEGALSHYKNFNEALRSYCAHEAPPSSNINSLLEEVLRTTRFVYKTQLEVLSVAATDSVGQATDQENTNPQSTVVSPFSSIQSPVGAIATREDALVLLEKAAKYFRTYEPHTPLAPGLERLVSWGRMTVSELMTELLPDDQSRAMYSQLTGVKLDGTDDQRYVVPPLAVERASQPGNREDPITSQVSQTAESSWDSKQEAGETEVGW